MTTTGKTKKAHNNLLILDGVINLILGIFLMLFPVGVIDLLGLPESFTHFYTSILGAVLFGVGIALIIERYGVTWDIRGLGLPGAIAINLCGGGILLVWLVFAPPAIPTRGKVVLWSVVVIVLAVEIAEISHLCLSSIFKRNRAK